MGKLLDDVLVSVSTIAIVVSLNHLIGQYIQIWSAYVLLGLGLFLLFVGLRIWDGTSIIRGLVIKTFGLAFIFSGIEALFNNYLELWWIYGIGGMLLYHYRHLISSWVG